MPAPLAHHPQRQPGLEHQELLRSRSGNRRGIRIGLQSPRCVMPADACGCLSEGVARGLRSPVRIVACLGRLKHAPDSPLPVYIVRLPFPAFFRPQRYEPPLCAAPSCLKAPRVALAREALAPRHSGARDRLSQRLLNAESLGSRPALDAHLLHQARGAEAAALQEPTWLAHERHDRIPPGSITVLDPACRLARPDCGLGEGLDRGAPVQGRTRQCSGLRGARLGGQNLGRGYPVATSAAPPVPSGRDVPAAPTATPPPRSRGAVRRYKVSLRANSARALVSRYALS